MRKQKVETVRPDSKARVMLGKRAEGVSGFRLETRVDGVIELHPQVELPAREAWLWKNPTAMAAVQAGLDQAASGKGIDLGDFTQYADIDDE